jgi:hypothetical protein
VKVKIEAVAYETAINVGRRQLETQIRKRFVRGAFVTANCALDRALYLTVEQSENETFPRFCVLQPCFL